MSTTIEIKPDNLRLAWLKADDNGKLVLETLFGSELVKSDREPKEWVKTFGDVCMAAGVDEDDYALDGDDCHYNVGMCLRRLKLIAQVFNGDWRPSIANTGQPKYYPWFDIIKDEAAAGGFRLSYHGYDFVFSFTYLGARPYFKDADTAIHVGKLFIQEYEQLLRWEDKTFEI